MLIFILPAAFYLKLVKKEPLRSPQKVGVSKACNFSHLSCSLTTRNKPENTHSSKKNVNCWTRMNHQRWIRILWWRERGLEFWLRWPGFLLFKYLSSSYLSEANGALPQAHMHPSLPTKLLWHYFRGNYAGRTVLRKNVNLLAMFVRSVRPKEKTWLLFPPPQSFLSSGVDWDPEQKHSFSS